MTSNQPRPIVLKTRDIIQNTKRLLAKQHEGVQLDVERALYVAINLARDSNYQMEVDDLLSEIYDAGAVVFDDDRDICYVVGRDEPEIDDAEVIEMNISNTLTTALLCPIMELITEHEYFHTSLRYCVFGCLLATNDIVLEPARREISSV